MMLRESSWSSVLESQDRTAQFGWFLFGQTWSTPMPKHPPNNVETGQFVSCSQTAGFCPSRGVGRS